MKSHLPGDTPLLSPRDVNFLLHEWLEVESLCKRPRFAEHSAATFDAVLDLAADIAAGLFAPDNKLADSAEITVGPDGRIQTIPDIKKALDALSAAGLLAGEFDEDLGGMQLPYVISKAAFTWLQAANVSTSAYAGLTIANAHLLARYGTPQQVDSWVRPMLGGRYFGTMCLSEPESGSSLADITTRAVRQDDGTYRVTGTKMWITGGDHELSENVVHLALATTPGSAAGVRGISLFIVPKYLTAAGATARNDVVLAGLNHKMGNRGTTNALLSLGDGTFAPGGRPRAVGYLVGDEGAGLAQMFHMMNEARIVIGISAAALGYTGYLQSLAYARTPGAVAPHRRPQVASAGTARRHHQAPRRPAHAHGPEELRRRRPRAGAVRRAAARRGHDGRRRDGARELQAAARGADAGRQELALAMVPRGEQPRDTGARRVRGHR